ncbi:hypothetical protein KKR91_12355 [Arthrobacter jiangjiafuii]|uniref:Membrane protein involved in the export of O-antigen and teichoic acid n=1 Tax=Arthrobacter jiangjiafuii TaxID=2817475 RepID=A0A975M3I8_9MICC|nr:hypothetical protein [Arthrobacter jiangjiafuii]MBP3044623.1 hypothetical protein [Arthrobacter jiangjiafuii]QWC09280.1 hypothetical protein KKR91_12355 [Arthrobacter jiangjiafuii]
MTSRTLSIEANAEFLAFWAALFFVQGTLGGIQAESTRATHAVVLGAPAHEGRFSRPLLSGGLTGLTAAVVILALWPLATHVFPSHTGLVMGALAIFAVLYSGHAALAGSLQGTDRWGTFANLVTLESLLRFGAILVASLLAAPLIGVELACLASLGAWLALMISSPTARSAVGARSDVGLGSTLRKTGYALLSAASSATLVVGFPILVKLTATPAEYDLSAPLLLAVSMTRAPIMIPLQAFQGVAMNLIMQGGGRISAYMKPAGAILLVGMLGAGLAALVGPALMGIFGPEYRISAWILAALTFAASLVALITLTGTAAIALGHHRVYSIGWILGTAVSVLLLLLPVALDLRCILSLTLGPLVGIVVHVAALLRLPANTARARMTPEV